MGKKYDAYIKAVGASNRAKHTLSQAEGGATLETLKEAKTNVEQARLIEEDLWGQVIMDPEG